MAVPLIRSLVLSDDRFKWIRPDIVTGDSRQPGRFICIKGERICTCCAASEQQGKDDDKRLNGSLKHDLNGGAHLFPPYMPPRKGSPLALCIGGQERSDRWFIQFYAITTQIVSKNYSALNISCVSFYMGRCVPCSAAVWTRHRPHTPPPTPCSIGAGAGRLSHSPATPKRPLTILIGEMGVQL